MYQANWELVTLRVSNIPVDGEEFNNLLYILLTKCEGCTERISAGGLDSTDQAQRGPYKNNLGPIFSQYGPEKDWLIRDLSYD